MKTSVAELVVLVAAILGVVVGVYLVKAGWKQGVRARRIEIDDSGRHLTGRDALVRGVVYIVLGTFLAAGSIATLCGYVIRTLGSMSW